MVFSCPIDYPGNNNPSRNRIRDSLTAIRLGANTIDLPINNFLCVNKKYDAVDNELGTIQKVCQDNGALLRCFIDTAVVDLNRVLPLIVKNDVEYIFPTLGTPLKSQIECLNMAYDISRLAPTKIILNPYFSQSTQTVFDDSYNIHGIRITSLYFHNFLSRF